MSNNIFYNYVANKCNRLIHNCEKLGREEQKAKPKCSTHGTNGYEKHKSVQFRYVQSYPRNNLK